jgi:ankyrin repeat protein
METEDQHLNFVRWSRSDYDAPMSTVGTGFSGAGRIVVLVCLILTQSLFAASAQTRPSQQEVQAFFNAIALNNTDAASGMLESNTNLARSTYNFSKRPLLEAAAMGNVQLVKRLLELGVDIDETGDTMLSGGSQSTALHFAIRQNYPAVCKLLLEAGANPNIMASGFVTPLHLAFTEEREEMAGWLLDYGADPFREKLFTNDKTTPFELSITRGDGKLVPQMLGQDRSHPLGTKSHVKSSSAKRQRQPAKTAADLLAVRGGVFLAAAAQRGELEAVQALLKAGVSAKGKAEDGTPLLQAFAVAEVAAAGKNDFDSVRWLQIRDLLIKHGADYDAFAATALGDIERVRRLSSADKSLAQVTNKDGQTPLHFAVQNNQLPMTAFWLQAGALPAATNLAGQTALHIAAGKKLAEHMKLLLAAHAPTDVRDTNGWTPLDAAIHSQNTEAIRLLLSDKSVVAPPDRAIATPVHEAASDGNLAALAALTGATNNLEARNELGLTPLQVAVLNGHLAAAALLVDRGANVNVRDPDGNTLLHRIIPMYFQLVIRDRPPTNWLARMGRDPRRELYAKYLTVGQYEQGPAAILQAASFLLASGIDVRATNHAGRSAIQLAADKDTTLFFDREPLLKLLGASGGNINTTDADGNTPLHRAGQDLLIDRTASLIASGADLNATNHQGRTPLHKFAEKIWSWDTDETSTNSPFRLLVKSGANVNAQDNDGLTPLHMLATANTSFKKEAVRLLLDAGANPNLRDKHGRTPAHLFLSGKWPWSGAGECVNMLVKAGADLSAKDDQGRTPLHYLAAMGNQNPLFFIRGITNAFVAAKVDFQARDNDGNTPLLIAAKTGTHDVFDWLVKEGASLDTTNNTGETPRISAVQNPDRFARPSESSAETDIFQAVRKGNIAAATRLLNADPQLANQTNEFQQTPLRLAAQLRQTNMIGFLETHGAKWDETSAVLASRPDALQAILKQRPSAVGTMTMGRGLVHIAADDGNVEIVKMLIAANCDLQAGDAWGLSPLGRALIKKNREMQALLLQRGARENFFDAVYANDLPAVTALHAQDKSLVFAKNHQNFSAMDVAAAAGYTDILKLLLKKSAVLKSATSIDGPNPVHLAAYYNQTNALALLIHAGANVNQVDRFGFTPLHWAAIRGATDAAVMLLKHKADANKATVPVEPGRSLYPGRDRATLLGDTPLHLAALRGDTNVLQLLLKYGADVNGVNGSHLTPLDLSQRMPPMNNFSLVMIQHGMLGLLEPLGVNQMRSNPLQARFEGQKAATALIIAAGGKHSHEPQPFGGWRGQP